MVPHIPKWISHKGLVSHRTVKRARKLRKENGVPANPDLKKAILYQKKLLVEC